MGQTFKTKIRRIGTSFGVIIPNELIKSKGVKLGEIVEIGLLKKSKLGSIERYFGIAKGARHFKRERLDRF